MKKFDLFLWILNPLLVVLLIVILIYPRGQESAFYFREDFSKPIRVWDGKRFGEKGRLTFELFRKGTFVVDGVSGYAWQKSPS